MRLKLTPLTENFGTLVEPYERKVVLPLSIQTRQEIIELFKLRGVLLFRGFNFDLQEFERFADFFGTSDAGFHPGLQGTPYLQPAPGLSLPEHDGADPPRQTHTQNQTNFLSLQPDLRIINGELPQDVVTANMIEIIDSFRSVPA